MSELAKSVVRDQLPKNHKNYMTDETLEEINKLAQDPFYGEEFLDSYMMHLSVLENSLNGTPERYLSAIKFFTLVESDISLTDAYSRVFPERVASRERANPDGWKLIVNAEASRYNKSIMVTEIRKLATIPVQLIHRHLLNEAILEQANLMRTARSEMVRQKASQTLIQELKPPEEQQINVKVEDGSGSVIEGLRKAAEALAAAEYQSVMAGVPLKQIANSNIIEAEAEEVDD